jgi:hypothetical protein
MSEEPERKRWWANTNREEAARELYALAQKNDNLNQTRRTLAKRDAACYEGFELTSFGPTGYNTDEPYTFPHVSEEEETGDDTPNIINVAKSIVQTETSKLAAMSKPKTAVVTTYGSHKDRRNAVKIDRLIDAEMKAPPSWRYSNIWAMTEHGFKLAEAATGTSVVKVTEYPRVSKVCYELHDSLDIGFDFDELTYGSPVSFFCNTWWDPHELASICEESLEDVILASAEEPPAGLTGMSEDGKRAKMVRVVEGWRITTGNTKGCYVMCIKDGVDLTDDDSREYDYDSPPLAFYHADRHLTGPWAQSTVSTFYHLMRVANEVTLSCVTSEKRNPKTLFWYDPESIETDDVEAMRDWHPIRAKQGQGVQKNPPQVLQPQPFARQNLEFVDWLIEKAHDIAGVPRTQTAAVREEGIPSAQGQRQMSTLASDRQAQKQHDYIQWVAVDIPKLALRAMKRIHARDGEFKRKWIKESKSNTSQKFIREISSSVFDDFDDNRYVLQPAAVGPTKGTPADRVQTALEGVQMGYIDVKRMAGILAHLDTPGESAEQDSQREWVEDQIDKWLYADEDELQRPSFYRGPMLSMDLDDLSLQVLQAFYRADKDIGDDDDEAFRLDYFTQFLGETDALALRKLQMQQPQQPPTQPVAA